MKGSDISWLLRAMDEAYERKAWHGPNLRGSLRGVTAQQAAWRPAPGRHSIWELAVHAAYWKYAVVRKLLGGKRGSFTLKGSNWFAASAGGAAGEKEWRTVLQLLDGEHRKLREAVESLRPEQLHKRFPGSRASFFDYILGVVFHDVYHAGQIQLLKRLHQSQARLGMQGL